MRVATRGRAARGEVFDTACSRYLLAPVSVLASWLSHTCGLLDQGEYALNVPVRRLPFSCRGRIASCAGHRRLAQPGEPQTSSRECPSFDTASSRHGRGAVPIVASNPVNGEREGADLAEPAHQRTFPG